jgi:hypothetical protein
MKATHFPRWAKLARRASLFSMLICLCLGVAADPSLVLADNAHAGNVTGQTPGEITAVLVLAPPPTATFGWTQGILGNRTRMVQITAVGMVVGIFFLWWGRDQK